MIKKRQIIWTAALYILLLPFAGCIGEDDGHCPERNNVMLEFRLSGGEVFRDKVSTVAVGIFDGDGVYLHTKHIDQAAIDRYEGLAMSLTPGDYRMVFWTNMNGNTTITGLDGRAIAGSPRVTYNRLTGAPPVTGNGDRLYYAPIGTSRSDESPQEYYSLTVAEESVSTGVVYFTHAHRSLEIYIKGLSADPAALPTVEITGLPAGLKYFGMKSLLSDPLKVIASDLTSLVERDGIVYAAAIFDTFRFDDMEGIYIAIKDAGGSELYRIALAEAVTLSNSDPAKIAIELQFSFMSGSVEVTVPGWKSDETGIEF